mmetsp:Transcript_24122/g.35361  ORF Transcript_24122/g.35361 Transcript_24122/m.35361 type:complete len:108 (+) Transcript_24122:163-486(+)
MQGMLRAATPVPKLCIVDLDKTVWSCFDAADTLPPYRRVSECEVRDASGRSIRIHAETPQMLQALRASACRLGIASLNPNHERWSVEHLCYCVLLCVCGAVIMRIAM